MVRIIAPAGEVPYGAVSPLRSCHSNIRGAFYEPEACRCHFRSHRNARVWASSKGSSSRERAEADQGGCSKGRPNDQRRQNEDADVLRFVQAQSADGEVRRKEGCEDAPKPRAKGRRFDAEAR